MLLWMSPVDLLDLKRMFMLHQITFVSARLTGILFGLNNIYSSSFGRIVGVTVVTRN